MQSELKELLPFLHDRNPQVRQIALSNLLGHTAKESTNRSIFFEGIESGGLSSIYENQCIRDLKLLCRDQLAIAHDAFRALVNLSDSFVLVSSLSKPSFLTFLVSYILNPSSILADLASMILSNITSSPSACEALITLRVPIIPIPSTAPPYYAPQSLSGTSSSPSPRPIQDAKEVSALSLLMQAFVQAAKLSGSSEERSWKGDLHFLASVFANVTMAPSGRILFLTPNPVDPLLAPAEQNGEFEYPLAQIVVFTEHVNTIRRGGIASTIKHCSFHVPAHEAILCPETEHVSVPPSSITAPGINALPYILLPLAGPEEFDLEDQEKLHPSLQLLPDSKKREPDEVLRLTHVESLILLATTRSGREYLRRNGVYEIIRTLHLSEQSDNVRQHIERLVSLLKGEERPLEEVTGDLWSHTKPEINDENDSQKRRVFPGEATRARAEDHGTVALEASDQDTDDDDKIVEV